MALSRKREKELARLKGVATDLWDDQKEVLEHAARIVREAGHHAAQTGREEVAPRLKDAIDNHLTPGIASGVSATRAAGEAARDKVSQDVLPAVSSALASALAILEVAKDPRVREALGKASKAGTQIATKAGVKSAKSGSGPGRYILIGLGLVAAAGVAYAAWQTLRADDELWVSDETEEPEAEIPDEG
ncbi:MAG TPA: hypothetical protein VGC18_10565 [Lacisediminihabitans sp.]|uniref:hypothetical protein n=1 Tax=Lacisediminihabitans sp. TaxID=2787631 RepID=UPI002EDA058D